MERSEVIHNIEPLYDSNSRILILGSFPSVKSREIQFFYGHKNNRFWPIMEKLFNVKLNNIEEKKIFLHSNHIALWDVIGSCTIEGSDDGSIKDVKPNDITLITNSAPIERIFVNGKKAYELFLKYNKQEATLLPSTSSANASYSFDRLLEHWCVIKY